MRLFQVLLRLLLHTRLVDAVRALVRFHHVPPRVAKQVRLEGGAVGGPVGALLAVVGELPVFGDLVNLKLSARTCKQMITKGMLLITLLQ